MTDTAVCPFCFALMTAEPSVWRCDQHGEFPRCPTCGNPLKPGAPHWCAWCRKWFEKLEER
jgi:NAD-dependent SIR2 family protein deacetylase